MAQLLAVRARTVLGSGLIFTKWEQSHQMGSHVTFDCQVIKWAAGDQVHVSSSPLPPH